MNFRNQNHWGYSLSLNKVNQFLIFLVIYKITINLNSSNIEETLKMERSEKSLSSLLEEINDEIQAFDSEHFKLMDVCKLMYLKIPYY